MHNLSKATVCRSVQRVTNVICDHLFSEIIRWPQNVSSIAAKFMELGGFPNVAGCIDGSLIPIDAPTHNEPAFVDRHGTHSVNALMVCGPDMSFYYVSAKWPGAVHDSRVLRNSTLCQKFENGWRPFPNAVLLGYKIFEYSSHCFLRVLC